MIFLLILFLILPIILAVEFDMKSEFKQGETLLAKISGNFPEAIQKENVFFYRGHVEIPMQFEIAKIENDFYIYASLLGRLQNNYSIVVKNTKYMKGAEIIDDDISKNFTITNETADFSIEPGFVTTEGAFSIEVQNLQDYEITVTAKTDSQEIESGFFDFIFGDAITNESSVTLNSGEIKKIDFEFKDITEPTLKLLELSTANLTYAIPVYVFTEGEISDEEPSFGFEFSEQNISIATDSQITKKIYLKNKGRGAIENISLFLSDNLIPYINLSATKIEEIEEGQEARIEFDIFSPEQEATIEGKITAKINDTFFTNSIIILNFIKDYIPPPENDSDPDSTKTCQEIGGRFCSSENETCILETIQVKDGNCCLAECKGIPSSSTGKLIGWSIVVVIVVFIFWFVKKKYSKAKKEVDFEKIAKGKK